MPNAAVVGNQFVCPLMTPGVPPAPHAGGVITKGDPTVLIGNMPAARVSDIVSCAGIPPHPDTIIKGSATVLISKMPAAYLGSSTACGGSVVIGVPTVMIGG
ncbi:MAG: PAAR domain-containing protein [Cytophagales bacterium]|jgi:uncharacterized Zn-binding protein involved in type VI secretion|nr:PAAR domain-containing protein [Cytophagales bacterium]